MLETYRTRSFINKISLQQLCRKINKASGVRLPITIPTRAISNLYDMYSPKNIWALYRLYKDDNTVIKQYIKDMISENNIFRLLYDIIGFSIGSSNKYSISSKNISYLTTIDEIDDILKNTEAKTEDQEFVLEVYKNYKHGITDEWGDMGIISEKILHLKP
ncbi:hypothetical protein [Neobacillus sp. FSL H8-0543]|uniref:hypothetical protein n=1 Tax=Neobacillus sp. FSL H8-0543 TaxID=2954672 RepID=UPI00315800D6